MTLFTRAPRLTLCRESRWGTAMLLLFYTLYLSDFKARLNLADASMSLRGTSPFGEVSLSAFIDHRSGILFCDSGSSFQEDVPLRISIERFGSRTFSMWYTRMKRDASIGLSGTEAQVDTSGAYITQRLTCGTFAAGGTVIESNGLTVNNLREHSRCATIQLTGKRVKRTLNWPLQSLPLLRGSGFRSEK